jgi:hypothetical protein
MMTDDRECRRAREDFDVYLDDELALPRVRAIEDHLAACESCRRLLAQRRREFAALGDLPADNAPEDFTERVMAGLAGRPLAKPAARWWPRLAYAAAVAAAAAIGLWLWAALHTPSTPGPVGPRQNVVERQRGTPDRPPAVTVHEPPETPPQEMVTRNGSPAPRPKPRAVTRAPRSKPKPRIEKPVPAPETRPAPSPEGMEDAGDPIAIADYRQLGLEYEREGMLEEALEAYELAAAEDGSPMLTIAMARVHERMGNTLSAIEMCAQAAFADYEITPEKEG